MNKSFTTLTKSHTEITTNNNNNSNNNNGIHTNNNTSSPPKQTQPHILNKTNYCLLVKDYNQDSNDKSFTLKTIESNCLEPLEFNIKSFIYQKISKNNIYKTGSFGVLDNHNNNSDDNNNNNSDSNNENNNNNNKLILSCFYTSIDVPIINSNNLVSLSSPILSDVSDNQEKQKQQQSSSSSNTELDLLDDEELISKHNKFHDDLENLDNLVDFSINDDLDEIVNDVLQDTSINKSPTTTTTTIATSNNSKKEEEEKEQEQEPHFKEYYLCLVCETVNDVNLGLFHLEISEFCSTLTKLISNNNENNNNNELSIKDKLTNWYSICIDYISRSVKLLDSNLPYIIHAALTGNTFKIIIKTTTTDDNSTTSIIAEDLISFLKTISIVNLSTIKLSSNELLIKPDEHKINDNTITTTTTTTTTDNNTILDTNNDHNNNNNNIFIIEIKEEISSLENNNENNNNITLIVNKKVDNLFCKKWSNKYIDNINNSISLRTLSEDLKLKVIQEYNMFRRMIDLSTMNNYLLYKSFLFLNNNDNSDILLYLLKKDNIQDIKEVLLVLENQLKQYYSK